MQRAYNLLSVEELKVDGIIGSKTIAAINTCPYQFEILQLLNILQGKKYIKIAENNNTQKKFLRGWLKRTVLITT